MKKALLTILLFALIAMLCGCQKGNEVLGIIGGADGEEPIITELHKGEGYSIYIPQKGFRYKKDYDDGVLEEKWESREGDNVAIKVTTYKNTDAETAQKRFLRESRGKNENLEVRFNVRQAEEDTYIVSWEYPKDADEKKKLELEQIYETYKTEGIPHGVSSK